MAKNRGKQMMESIQKQLEELPPYHTMMPGAPLEPLLIPGNVILYSPGNTKKREADSLHFCHSRCNFIAVADGELDMNVDGCLFHLRKNNMLLIRPFSRHFRPEQNLDHHVFYISFSLPDSDIQRMNPLMNRQMMLKKNDWRVIRSAIREFQAWHKGEPGASGRTVLRVAELLNGLLARQIPGPSKSEKRNYRTEQDSILQQIIQYIHEHLNRHISIEDVAAAVKLSPSTVRTLFLKQMKRNIGTYIRGQRLTQACSLLQGTGMTLAEIAVKVGYESENALSRAISRACGKTPSRIRRSRQTVGPEQN